MIREKLSQPIYINNTCDFLNKQRFRNPLYIVESNFMDSDFVYLKSQEHKDFLSRTITIDNSKMDIKTYTHTFIGLINNNKYDVLIVVGSYEALELGKYYLYLSHKMLNDFYDCKSFIIPQLLMVGFIDYPHLVTWPQSKYPYIVPDYILAEAQAQPIVKMSTLMNDTLKALQQGMDQFMFHILNEKSSQLTLNCIQLIYRHVIAAYKRRTPESIISLEVAVAIINDLFSLERVGLSHHISSSITQDSPMENPILSFMLLQQTLKVICMDKQMEKQLSKMAIYLGLDFKNPLTNSVALIESLKMMQEALDLPTTFSEIGIDNQQVFSHIDQWSIDAVEAVEKLGYDINLTNADMRRILLQLM